jgi:hypothetical protein
MRAPSGRGSAIQPLESFHVSDRSKLTLGDAPVWPTLRSHDHISIPIGLAGYSERWYQRNCFLNHASLS